MKWLSIAIVIMALFAFSPSKSAEADSFSFSVGFHDELSPYGTWVNFSNYGNVWRPYGYSGWQPYSDGYWGHTSYGPTWYGNEPYAPYVYHYGNWIFTPAYGWVWIPGYDWHAGRVNWSYGGGYIGWRPQFPSGYNYGYGNDYNYWTVIASDRFGYNSYRPYRLSQARVRDLFERRVFRQRYDTLRRADLERVVRRPLRTINVREREVRIGDRRARLVVTPDQEVRIRKHVTQIRGRAENRKNVERETVLKQKFDDIRTKSNKKEVSKPSKEVRKSTSSSKEVKKPTSISKSKKAETKKVEKKSVISSRDRGRNDRDPVVRSNFSRKSEPDRVKKASSSTRKSEVSRSSSTRKPEKVERSQSVRKTEVRSTGSDRKKPQVSSKRSVKKESVRKQKPGKKD